MAAPAVGTASQEAPGLRPVGWRFVAGYTAAYAGSCLMLIAPLLVTLALKVNALVGTERAPARLALVAATGSLLAMVANPVFGRLSDRTTSAWGMRRPWMVIGLAGGCLGILTVALAPTIAVVLVGWCVAQVFFNALLAAQAAVLPDQVPARQRGLVSGVLGVCVPLASVAGTFLVDQFAGHPTAMFLAPCALGAVGILLFAARIDDRRLAASDPPAWSLRELAGTFAFSPRSNPDFGWVFLSRFLFVMAYAFLTAYQAYYLINRLGSPAADVPHQIFVATLLTSTAVVAASLTGGRLSDRVGRRKPFVVSAAALYGVAMFTIASATDLTGFLVGAAMSGLGFGAYIAVDLALVTDVLPDKDGSAAKDLGVFNIANALPYSVAPALAPAVLAAGGGSYSVLFAVAGGCALLGAAAILPVRGVR